MDTKEFERLRSEANALLTCIDVAEEEGALRWAINLRVVARVAASLSASAKDFEKRERAMNWRPAGPAKRKLKVARADHDDSREDDE